MKKKSVGIIGPGQHFTKRIYSLLLNSDFFQMQGILRSKKIKFKNIKIFNETDFFRKKFDFIYIAAPNQLHEKFIIKSLKNGSHVICEKPFVTSNKNIKKILYLSKSKQKLIFESFAYIYHPVFNFIKQIINKKKYGDIKYVISNFRYPSLNLKDNKYKAKEGDGFYNDSGVYLVSLENYLFNSNNRNLKFQSQKIRNQVDLRGNIFISSPTIKRFYFWGEGQNYSNNLEIFFSKGTIFINKFFSKNDDEKIHVKIHTKNKLTEKIFKQTNQFEKMFEKIIKNYNKKSFQEYNRKKIENQINLLFNYNN